MNELSTQEILSLLEELREKNVFCLALTGGEPLLHRDFLTILRYAANLNFIVSVGTNGILLTDSLLRQFPRENVRITVSLDNLHLNAKGQKNKRYPLSHLQQKLLLVRKHGIGCNVSSTMTRENLPELEALFCWLEEHNITFRCIPFTPIGRGASHKHLQLQPPEIKKAAKLWEMEVRNEIRLQNQTGLTFSAFYDYALTLVFMSHGCKGGRFLAYICSNGDVYPCTTCVGKGLYRAENIRKVGFHEIWDSSLRDFRRLTLWENFTQCECCRFSSPDYFCTNRCPPLAIENCGVPFACGATPYDRGSLALRTRLLDSILQKEQGA
jgi:radical SAM protein with 4Fe4S-binding SPASM domain